MPHKDFDATRRAYAQDRDPVTFTYGGERFTVLPDPTIGDMFDLMDAPEIDPDFFDADKPSDAKIIRVLENFVKRMLPEEDRARFEIAHYRIPSSQALVLMEVAQYIAEQVTGNPTEPSES